MINLDGTTNDIVKGFTAVVALLGAIQSLRNGGKLKQLDRNGGETFRDEFDQYKTDNSNRLTVQDRMLASIVEEQQSVRDALTEVKKEKLSEVEMLARLIIHEKKNNLNASNLVKAADGIVEGIKQNPDLNNPEAVTKRRHAVEDFLKKFPPRDDD